MKTRAKVSVAGSSIAKISSVAAKGAEAKSVVLGAIATVTCFPAGAMISLDNGTSLRMDEVQVGDKVKTGVDILMISLKSLFIIKMTHNLIRNLQIKDDSNLWTCKVSV